MSVVARAGLAEEPVSIGTTEGPRARVTQNALIVGLLALYLTMGWLARPPMAVGPDDVVYLALSRSLEAGSYREVFQASAPLHVQYPPGYPAWLVLVRRATNERIDLIPAVNLGLVALSLLIFAILARRLVGGWFAIALLLPLVLNPSLLWSGGSYLSEALYTFLSTAALAATFGAGDRGKRSAYAAIALALLAFLTRAAGVALVAAIGIWVVSRRRRTEVATFAAASLLVVGGWFAYAAATPAAASVNTYRDDFISGEVAARPAAERPTAIASFARRVWHNASWYGSQGLPSELSLPTVGGTLIDNWLWLLLTISLLGVGLIILWQRWRAAAVYVVLYAGMLVVWAWPVHRFLWPIIPLLLLTFLIGAWRFADRVPRRIRFIGTAVLVGLMAMGAARDASARMAQYRGCDRDTPSLSSGCYSLETRGIVLASQYVKQHDSTGGVVLAAPAAVVNLFSGHLTESANLVRSIPRASLPRVLHQRGIRHVLLVAGGDLDTEALAPALLESCSRFEVEARFAPGTLLLAPADSGGARGDACAALAEYARANGVRGSLTPGPHR